MIILVNRLREIAYRSAEKKTLANNATFKFKLSNPLRTFEDASFLSFIEDLYSNKVF